jgi:uncharacterized surface protein with fasciclin (FAS1) repeats
MKFPTKNNPMRFSIQYLTIFFLLLIAAGCIKKESIPPSANNITASLRDLLVNNFSFSIWYEAMQRSGTDSLLDDNSEGYTLFAPDNSAFERAGISLDSLRRIGSAELRRLVLYHVLPGRINSADVPQTLNYSFSAMSNDLLYTSTNAVDTNLYVNGIQVVRKNIMAKNGFIHALESTLTLPAASVQDILAADPDYSCLVAGFKKFNLWDELKGPGPMVVLAPNNDAFAAYNWDVDAINGMNTNEFRKMAFGTYILKPAFFFIPNVRMAPPAGPFVQDDTYLLIGRGGNGMDAIIKAVPSNYRDAELSSRNIFYGDWVTYPYAQPGKLAVNGILHEAPSLNVIPDSARVK